MEEAPENGKGGIIAFCTCQWNEWMNNHKMELSNEFGVSDKMRNIEWMMRVTPHNYSTKSIWSTQSAELIWEMLMSDMLCCGDGEYVTLHIACFWLLSTPLCNKCVKTHIHTHKKEWRKLLTDYMACRYTDDLEVFQKTHQYQDLKNEGKSVACKAQTCEYKYVTSYYSGSKYTHLLILWVQSETACGGEAEMWP
jgi:hypothetical protein